MSSSERRKTIAVIGAGIVGVSTAYFTVKRIKAQYGDAPTRPRVVLIEQCEPACSASGKSGGFLARHWSDGTDTEQLARFGYDLHAKLAAELSGEEKWGYRTLDTYCAEIDRIPTTPAKHRKSSHGKDPADSVITSIEVIAPRTSTVPVKFSRAATPEDDLANTHGSIPVPNSEPVRFVEPETVPWLRPKVITKLGQVGDTTNTAQVDPLRLVRMILAEARALGLEMVKGKVIDVVQTGYRPPMMEFAADRQRKWSNEDFLIVEPSDSITSEFLIEASKRKHMARFVVSLDQGSEVPADKVVVACGAWATSCLSWQAFLNVSASQIPIQGLRVHYLIAKPKQPLGAQAVFAEVNGTVYSGEDAIEIYSRRDGSVFICGEALDDPEMPPHNPFEPVYSKRATNRLKHIVNEVSTALSSDVIHYGLACHLPVHAKGIPVISPVPGSEGLFIAAGHGCWGILNGLATGLAMSELLLDGKCSSLDLDNFRLNRWY